MEAFNKPRILKIARAIAKRQVCNNCLGRQLAQISTGMTNKERGRILRKLLKMKEPKKCTVCDNLFKNLNKYAKEAEEKLRGIQFKTFLVGSKLHFNLINNEEGLWEEAGIEYCEPLKAELNREFGKLIFEKLKNKSIDVDEKNPNIVIILNLQKNRIEININPLFVSGKYQKLVRGIPQTKWDKYPETVEDIIAKPFMAATKGAGHALHGMGREDIDARCLDWRPFVFEVITPKKREINLKEIEKEVNKTKKVKVKDLSISNKKEVIRVKEMMPDKTYRALVDFTKVLKIRELEKINSLKGTVNQYTPKRVLHRRADKLRKKRVKNIKWKRISNKRLELEIRGEAGLYIKEFITGDDGRTRPSVSEVLNNPAEVKELDVIKIHLKGD